MRSIKIGLLLLSILTCQACLAQGYLTGGTTLSYRLARWDKSLSKWSSDSLRHAYMLGPGHRIEGVVSLRYPGPDSASLVRYYYDEAGHDTLSIYFSRLNGAWHRIAQVSKDTNRATGLARTIQLVFAPTAVLPGHAFLSESHLDQGGRVLESRSFRKDSLGPWQEYDAVVYHYSHSLGNYDTLTTYKVEQGKREPQDRYLNIFWNKAGLAPLAQTRQWYDASRQAWSSESRFEIRKGRGGAAVTMVFEFDENGHSEPVRRTRRLAYRDSVVTYQDLRLEQGWSHDYKEVYLPARRTELIQFWDEGSWCCTRGWRDAEQREAGRLKSIRYEHLTENSRGWRPILRIGYDGYPAAVSPHSTRYHVRIQTRPEGDQALLVSPPPVAMGYYEICDSTGRICATGRIEGPETLIIPEELPAGAAYLHYRLGATNGALLLSDDHQE